MLDEPETAPVESGIPTFIKIDAVSEHPFAKLATLNEYVVFLSIPLIIGFVMVSELKKSGGVQVY